MKRRILLKGMTALLAAPWLSACGRTPPAAETGNRLERIGIQLYTVRDRMAADLPGTLQKIAQIGYDEVEFAGYFEHTPAQIKGFLDAAGLVSPSAHTSIDAIRTSPERLIETAQTLGNRYIALGWLAPEERRTLDDYRRHIDLVADFAAQCRGAGLRFAWHNHDFEFTELEGQRPIDLLLDATDPELVQVELDLYWIAKVGVDPLDYFKRYPGRFPLCHIKDMTADGRMADVGDGGIDFAAIFASGDLAGFKHYYIERDDSTDTLQTAARSYQAAHELTF